MSLTNRNLARISTEILVTALLWVLLFTLNTWLFSATEVNQYISWVFLPAALRMVSVLLLGGSGALGLILGSLMTSNTEALLIDAVVLAVLSGLCPYISVTLCHRLFKLSRDLSGLTGKQLLVFAIAGGVLSVIPHHLYFYAAHQVTYLFDGAASMLAGDILGALILLYLARLIIGFCDRIRSNTAA